MQIDEGYSFHYIFYSLAFIVFGILIAFFNVYLGIATVLLATLFLFDKGGTVFDFSANKIGRYHSLFGRKRYTWTSLNNYNSAELNFEFISQKMNSRGTSSTMRTKSYQLKLKDSESEFIFHEYSNYEIAKKVIHILEEKHHFKTKDILAEVQKSAFDRRMSRGKK